VTEAMLGKYDVLHDIVENKVVAVLRGDSAEQAETFAHLAIAGGIGIIEVTMTVPGAIGCIERLQAHYASEEAPSVRIGIGSVLDAETARLAILAGAEFVVTPMVSEDVIRLCNRYGIPTLPGAYTVREVIQALEAGADIVKLFPGDMGGPGMISALKGPLPQANFMPTGGVRLDNVQAWLEAGAVAVGIGSDLTKEAVKSGDLDSITRRAKAYVDCARGNRT